MDKQATRRTHGAVIYSRVSTGEQAEHGTSLESQRDACLAKALALDLPIIAELEDAGVSGGFLLSRAGMQDALTLIREGRADTLICATISRYSRDREHQAAIKREVKAAGGRLVFCDMDFADTPEGDLAFNIMGDFAQFEKATIRKRLQGGLTSRAKNGVQVGRNTSPYGYHIVRHADVIREEYPAADLGKYIIVEEQAAHVRWMFDCYHAGTHSLTKIAQALNAQAIPPPGKSARWMMSTVRYILGNTVYKGMAVYGKNDNETRESRFQERHWRTGDFLTTPRERRKADPETWILIPCPAIVSEEVWEAVQTHLHENKKKKGGNPARVSMLAGRVFCPHCNGTLYCCGNKTRPSRTPGKPPLFYPARYVCGNYFRELNHTGKSDACASTGYPKPLLENAVLRAMENAAQQPEAVRAALAAYSEPETSTVRRDALRQELTALDKAIEDVKKKEAATVQAQIAGIVAGASPDAYAEAFASLAARRKDLEERRGAVSVSLRKLAGSERQVRPEREFDAILGEMHRILESENLTGAQKRDIIAPVIAKVVPHREGDARYTDGADAWVDVHFVPGAFEEKVIESVYPSASETLQPSRLGSLRTRALFSEMSAFTCAAKGRTRWKLPPDSRLGRNSAGDCPKSIG